MQTKPPFSGSIIFSTIDHKQLRLDTTYQIPYTQILVSPKAASCHPFFSHYTQTTVPVLIPIKYADDTAIVSKITDNNTKDHHDQIGRFTNWCSDNYLKLNPDKTKEIIFDFRRNSHIHPITQVHDTRSIAINIWGQSQHLTASNHISVTFKKCMQRIHHLRILNQTRVKRSIITLAYKALIESIIRFSLLPFYSSLNRKYKQQLKKILKYANKSGATTTSIEDIYEKEMIRTTSKIVKAKRHPLNSKFSFLKSGNRLRCPKITTTRFKNSFVPSAIRLYNFRYAR